MGFNPADYAAVENTAKSMSKPELEKYYVERKNAKHLSPGDTIMTLIGILSLVFLIGFIGSLFPINNFVEDIQEVSVQVADEVCPISDDIYFDIDLKYAIHDFEIDCSTYRHK